MNIQVLGAHICESQNTRLVSLLIDNVLALDAGGITSSLSFQAQQEIKAVLVTHQHYDHIKDIPTLAMNAYVNDIAIEVFSTQAVRDTLTANLLNGKIYPNFLERPPKKPTIKFNVIEPNQTEQFEGYSILAAEVVHSVPAVGYQITSTDGKTVFYTGDTGPGLAGCWKIVSPQLLITEVSVPDKHKNTALELGHLTPSLLKQELISFREIRGYLPQVVVVHMNPRLEEEIAAEIAAVAIELDSPIDLAYEGMQLHL